MIAGDDGGWLSGPCAPTGDGWALATWTLTTDASREVLEAVLRELGYEHMVAYIEGAEGELEVSLIGLDRERPSVELERIRVLLVKLGRQAECSLLR